MTSIENISDLQRARAIRLEAAAFVAKNGSDVYYDFLLEHGRRPDRKEATAIGMLLGRQVLAADNSLQPIVSKGVRAGRRNTNKAEKADLRVDIELNRALDAISFLAKNEIDPAPLIARISTFESEELTEQVQKAVVWLNRFADGWLTHVNIGIEEIEVPFAGRSGSVGRKGLRIVRSRDCGS